jgi:hypothetical protein
MAKRSKGPQGPQERPEWKRLSLVLVDRNGAVAGHVGSTRPTFWVLPHYPAGESPDGTPAYKWVATDFTIGGPWFDDRSTGPFRSWEEAERAAEDLTRRNVNFDNKE